MSEPTEVTRRDRAAFKAAVRAMSEWRATQPPADPRPAIRPVFDSIDRGAYDDVIRVEIERESADGD